MDWTSHVGVNGLPLTDQASQKRPGKESRRRRAFSGGRAFQASS
jgi:hypothetical protein